MKKLTRRDFLRLSAVTAAGAVAAACAQPTPMVIEKEVIKEVPVEKPVVVKEEVVKEVPKEVVVEKEVVKEVPVEKVVEKEVVKEVEKVVEVERVSPRQAPMLQELVKAGELPPLEERLPVEPLVLPVIEEIGEYGGTWRRAYNGIADRWGPTKCVEEYWWEYNPDLTIRANLATSWDVSDDAKEWTMHMRKGVKWSDGEEFNTDDIKFFYEAIWKNKTLTPAPEKHTYWAAGGVPMEIEILDNYTFKIKFAAPNITLGVTTFIWNYPEHYLKQFHPDYVPMSEVEKAMEEEEVDTWDQMFNHIASSKKYGWWVNPDLPVLWAWRSTVPPPGDLIEMERNPYFWQVDPEGNQLPYIDRVTHRLYESAEVFNMWLISGEIDMMQRHVQTANYTLYKENEEKGDYRVLQWRTASHVGLNPNQTCPDEVLAELFANKDFRHAMSIAINREDINETIYEGLCECRQISPVSGSPQFDPEFETKWIEYDPDTANELLDGIGLEMGPDGVRRRPDGKPLEVILETTADIGSPDLDTWELVTRYFADVGIKASVKRVERSLYTEHFESGDIEIACWGADRNALPMKDPTIYLGTCRDRPWITMYGLWYSTGGAEGIEPPADHPCREIWSVWEDVQTTPDLKQATKKFQRIIDIHKENVFNIGVLGECASLIIAKNNFRNIVGGYITDDPLRDVHLLKDPQFFIRQT